MEKQQIEAKIIKTYRLPLFDLAAKYYTSTKQFLLAVMFLLPVLIILARYNFDWQWILKLSPLELICIITVVRFFLYIKDTTSFGIWCRDMMNNPDHASIYSGAPGTGKTFTAVFATYYMAIGSWKKLQWEYFKLIGKMQKEKLKAEELQDKDKEIYESYQYMIKHEGIPCLGTNIAVYSKRYKRFSYKIGPSYLKQQRRAPYRFVGLYDEVGTVFNFELSNDKTDKYRGQSTSDYARFCRQFTEMRFIGTEQNGGNMFKGIRNVVARYREYTSFERIFQPKVLIWIFEKLQKHFVEPIFGKGMNVNAAKRWAGFMDKFEQFIDKVGYVRLRYRDFGHNDQPIDDKSGKGTLYFPCCAEFVYDTRAFRFAYEARDKKLQVDVFKDMNLTPEEARTFLRAKNINRDETEKQAA